MRKRRWVLLGVATAIALWSVAAQGATHGAGVRAMSEKVGVELGQPLQFYCHVDGVPPEAVKQYNWDFGDGGTSTEQNPKYTFKDEGTYSVTVIVILKDGKKLSDTLTVQAQKECQC